MRQISSWFTSVMHDSKIAKKNLGFLKYRYVIFSHLVLLLKAVMGSSELCTKQFNVSGFFLYKKMVLYDDILLGNVTV